MDEQSRFRTALAALSAGAENRDRTLKKEEVQEFFKDMDLDEGQHGLVYAYLASKRIRVEGVDLPDVPLEEQPYTEEEKAFLEQYKKDMHLMRKQPENALSSLSDRASDGDGQAKKLLTEHCLDWVISIAEEYAHRGVLIQDLVQEGNLGLMIGVDTLGLREEGQSWEAYLEHEIRRTMRTALDEQAGSESTSEQIAEKLNCLADSITELTEDMGRQVTPEELSLYLDTPLEEIEDLLRIAGENIELADEKQGDS
ncbi:MAG: hypothetical protein HFI16_00405 [Lachnospiraceae bacterium]|nr:hypothetical protein [Lachnospiraceae bacterium]